MAAATRTAWDIKNAPTSFLSSLLQAYHKKQNRLFPNLLCVAVDVFLWFMWHNLVFHFGKFCPWSFRHLILLWLNVCAFNTLSSLINTWLSFIKSLSLFHLLYPKKKHIWLWILVISKRKRSQSLLNAVCKIKSIETCRKICCRVWPLIHVRWVVGRVCFPVSDVVPGCKANSTKLAEFLAKNKETGAEKIASAKRITLVSTTSTVVRMFFFF